jgi:enterochelin esterase-like enzyme
MITIFTPLGIVLLGPGIPTERLRHDTCHTLPYTSLHLQELMPTIKARAGLATVWLHITGHSLGGAVAEVATTR